MSKVIFTEETAPNTPDSGTVVIYAKSDGSMYQKDDTGTETALGSAGGGTVTSVGVSTDANYLTIVGSPITTSGTVMVKKATGQTANQVVATPDGSTGTADLRSLTIDDLPGSQGESVAYYETTGSADASWTLSGWSSSTDYTKLIVDMWLLPTNTATLYIRPNNDTTAANYYTFNTVEYSTATTVNALNNGSVATLLNGANYWVPLGANYPVYVRLTLARHNNTGIYTSFDALAGGNFSPVYNGQWGGWWEQTTAVSSIYVGFSTGNIDVQSGYRVWQQ